RRVGTRPPRRAGPECPPVEPPRRADDARLARLVRHVERRRRLAAVDAATEQALSRARARLVRTALPRRDEGPGDAALAERERQLEVVAERELRARDDGALLARRRPRVHRAGRSPAGARAHGLAQRLARQRRPDELPLRRELPRRRREAHL